MAMKSILAGLFEGAGMRKKNNNLKFLVVFLVLIGFSGLFAPGVIRNQSTQSISLPDRGKVIGQAHRSRCTGDRKPGQGGGISGSDV